MYREEQVSKESRLVFESIENTIGRLPNIYGVIGNSSNALVSYLKFSDAQKSGTFDAKDREAIALAVSEENGCNYCKAAHTAIAKMNGFSDEETLQLRVGTHYERKYSIITNPAKSIIVNRGKPLKIW